MYGMMRQLSLDSIISPQAALCIPYFTAVRPTVKSKKKNMSVCLHACHAIDSFEIWYKYLCISPKWLHCFSVYYGYGFYTVTNKNIRMHIHV